jgi:hypothetical protein
VTTMGTSPTPRRRPFAAIRKGLVEHVRGGRFNATQLGVYVWLHLLADHTTGTVRTNATVLANELRIHPVTVRRHLAALKRNGYLRYSPTRVAAQLFEIAIEKYDRHFEDQVRALHGPLQGRLHVGAASARGGSEIVVPKKKDERSVRFADRDRSAEELLRRSQTRARETNAARDDDQSHPTTWTRTGARRGADPQPSYPAGVTRLR